MVPAPSIWYMRMFSHRLEIFVVREKDLTCDLIKLIGSPYAQDLPNQEPELDIVKGLQHAFINRIPTLFLEKIDGRDKHLELVSQEEKMWARAKKTREVLVRLANKLNKWNPDGYVIFKSIKPYPGTPNDTDVLILGGRKEFNAAIEQKQVQEQEALKEVNITRQEEEKKKQAILQAEAVAQKTRLEAQALSINANIIDKILAEAKLEAAKNWNGVLPTHMYGSAPIPLVNITQ